MGEPAGNSCVVDRASARYQSNQRRHRDRTSHGMCGRPDFGQQGEHSNDAQPRLTRLIACPFYACAGEASKTARSWRSRCFQPDQIEGLLRTNGRSQFLATLAAAMADNSGGFSPPLSTCLLPLRPAASPPKPPNNLCARQCPDELAHRLSLLLVPDLGNVADDIEQHTLV